MVTISMQPYTLRKIWLIVAGLICLSSISCFANSLYLNVNSTPYDRQMARILPVLFSGDAASKQDLSMSLVNHWMGDLRTIPYGFFVEWKTPAELQTEAV